MPEDFNSKLRRLQQERLERGIVLPSDKAEAARQHREAHEKDLQAVMGKEADSVFQTPDREKHGPADPDRVQAFTHPPSTGRLSSPPSHETEGEAVLDLVPSYPRFEFITGQAGTGKTYLVKERARRDPGVELCATTGIASVNLGEGTTINAFLKYFDTASLRDAYTENWLQTQLVTHARSGVRQIVLDEVSMLDGEQLSILCFALDDANETLEAAGEPGLGLTLTGDFCQLPPVKAKFAFEVDEWKRFEENTTRLTKIWRQEDKDFVEALGFARAGHGAKACEFFARYLQEQVDHDYDGSTVMARNDAVDNYNRLRMSKVKGEWCKWGSERWGDQRPDWKNIPQQLDLKVGALVMILANKKKTDPFTGKLLDEIEYANGDLGELVDSSGKIKLRRGPVVQLESVERQWLKPFEVGRKKELKQIHGTDWQKFVSKDGKKEVVGGISYVPLRVAYATTVHKSQGLSLDNVQVNLRDHFFKTPGMLYVALSRCRTADGLRLVGNSKSFIERCTVDARVKPWL